MGLLFQTFILIVLNVFNTASAAPLYWRQSSPTVVSQDVINSTLQQPALFARVAYCPAEKITALSCGMPCDALGQGVEVLSQGGDNGAVPYYYIAHDPSNNAIIVAHQGTDPQNILSVVNDVKVNLVDINATRFPDTAGKDIKVHDGFQETFERTADGVLAGVQSGLSSKGSTKVILTGHSLGAAIAVMDGLMVKAAVDPSVDVQTVTFGTPRGGNSNFANFIDSTLSTSQMFLTDKDDIVPRLPPTQFGFQHSSGEIHVNKDSGNAIVSCPGQENEDKQCADGDGKDGGALGFLPDINLNDHFGPYINNISFGGDFCQ